MLDLEYWPMKYLTICSSNIIEGGTRESGCPTMNGPVMMAWDKVCQDKASAALLNQSNTVFLDIKLDTG